MALRARIIALLLLGACSDGRGGPRKLPGIADACGEDCGGQLQSHDCAAYAPGRFGGGVVRCTGECTVDTSGCVERDPSACNPLQAQGCPPGQICVQLGSSLTSGVCVEDTPAPACTDGTTRCAGSVLESCSAGVWQSTEDCAASGGSCGAGSSGYACVPAAAACSDGTARCSDSLLERCQGGAWVTAEDCARNGATCSAGACQASGGCDYDGHAAGTVKPMIFDELAAAFYKTQTSFVALSIDGPGGAPSETLQIEIYPELGAPAPGAPATIDLGGQSRYDGCSVCVVGARGVGGTTRYFMPASGTLELSAYAAEVGQSLTATLRAVVLREVTIDPSTLATTDVAGGSDWCLGAVTYSAPAERYGCVDEGLGACVDGSRFVRCEGGVPTPVSCGGAQVCRESAARVASCTAPLESSACDLAGHWSWSVFTFYDNDVWRYHSLMSMGYSTGETVFVENFPDAGGRTTPGTVQLTGSQSDPYSCSTCVYGTFGGRTFMARYGVAELTDLPAQPGGLYGATLRSVELHEVDANFFEVPGGYTWCLGASTLGNFTTRFPCLQGGPGDRSCVETRLAECNADSEYTLVSECADAGALCEPTGAGTAECRASATPGF